MSFLHSQVRALPATNPIFIRQITPNSRYRLWLEFGDPGFADQTLVIARLEQMGAEIVTRSPGKICLDIDSLAQAAEIAYLCTTQVYYDFDTEMGNGE